MIATTAWTFRQASTSHLRLYAGAKELLTALRTRGSGVYLLSNAQALFTLPELRQLGVIDCFDKLYISSDCGWRKPARQFIERLLREQALDPKQCLMIGNDPNTDVAVANSVGMDSVYVRSATSPPIDPASVPATRYQKRISLRSLQSML